MLLQRPRGVQKPASDPVLERVGEPLERFGRKARTGVNRYPELEEPSAGGSRRAGGRGERRCNAKPDLGPQVHPARAA